MSDSFENKLIAFLPNLKRYALSLCRREDVADDLVQTTVERAFDARKRMAEDVRLEAWLMRILRNAWIDMTRRNRTRGIEINANDAYDMPSIDGVRDIEARLMLDKTQAALLTLSEEQRDVVTLICIEEMSYREAADILDLPIGTVMSRLARGRAALAEKLGIN